MTARARLPLGRRVLFAAVLLVGSLLAAEGVLRLVLPVAKRASLPNDMIRAHLEGAAFRYDPDLFWYWSDPGADGSPVNEHGFVRAEPMTVEKPAGVTRVITFGDSQTFGAGMPPDKTYSAFAEAALGDAWEVLDAGMSGYRSLNVYRLLRLRMLAYAPDAVVIDCMPFDSPRDDGSLAGTPLVRTPLDTLRRALWHSRLYYSLRLGLEVADPWRARWLDADEGATRVAHGPPGPQGPPLAGPQGPPPAGSPAPTEPPPGGGRDLGNHDLILEWGRENGVAVLFMQYPIMTHGGEHACMTGPGELPEGAPVIPACDRLAASGIPAPRLFQDRNHLTEEGNRLVGSIVAESLAAWAASR